MAIDARHINKYVNELGTNFIVSHEHCLRVGSDVDFSENIKQEGFLDI